MALELPENMDDLLYFTRRKTDVGSVFAWLDKKECPKCKKALMGKPVDKGKIKIRSTEYVCPECSYTEAKLEHESDRLVSIVYTCGKCNHKGETQVPFKRKTFQGVKAIVFECESCKEIIPITKKMADLKKKKKKK